MKSIREIARTLGNICVDVGKDKRLWGKIKDKRIQTIIARLEGCDVYYEALTAFCSQIENLPHSPTDVEFSAYTMREDWFSAWLWFKTHPDAVCLVNRAIEANTTPEDLKQFSFKLSRFVRLALQQELDAICQMTKNYILEVYREQ